MHDLRDISFMFATETLGSMSTIRGAWLAKLLGRAV